MMCNIKSKRTWTDAYTTAAMHVAASAEGITGDQEDRRLGEISDLLILIF
jgi:hypothetical protein